MYVYGQLSSSMIPVVSALRNIAQPVLAHTLLIITPSQSRGSNRGSLRFHKYFCQRKAAVVLRRVAEGLRFDCSQHGSFTVFPVYLRFPVVLWGLNRIKVKG